MVPRSTVTDSVYGRKRSYMSVTVYNEIWRNTKTVSDRIFPIYGRKSSYLECGSEGEGGCERRSAAS